MTTWHWIRHGPTHEQTFVGWRDVPADLSDLDSLARLNAALPQEAIIVSSDLRRSVATADALTVEGRQRLPHEAALREIHFGLWDGMHRDDIVARDPALFKAFWRRPGAVAAPAGESWDETAARVSAVVDRLSDAHPGASFIAVAHFGVILTQVQRTLGGDARAAMRHKIDNLSVTSLCKEGESWRAVRINHVP